MVYERGWRSLLSRAMGNEEASSLRLWLCLAGCRQWPTRSYGYGSATHDDEAMEMEEALLTLPSVEAYSKKAQERSSKSVHRTKKGRSSSPSSSAFGVVAPQDGDGAVRKLFSSLDLSPWLKDRLRDVALEEATEVQWSAIPILLEGRDAAIQSYTGSGKTLAYAIPILSRISVALEGGEGRQKAVGVNAVVVAPSRELGMQIVREFEKLLGPTCRKDVQQLVGGANRERQEEALKKNKPTIIVGTPGRICEISRAGKLRARSCRAIVLDEADQLFSASFRRDTEHILEHLQTEQLIVVSSTMPPHVLSAVSTWGCQTAPPALIQISPKPHDDTLGIKASLPPSLCHYYTLCPPQSKLDYLRKCIHALNAKSVIVFTNHPSELKEDLFKLKDIEAAGLHGELRKLERSRTLAAFRSGKLRVLLMSDVGARGLDIPECDLVVNLDLPPSSVQYAHRAGRTGRLGRSGVVLTICQGSQVFVMKKFRRQLEISITECDFAEGKLVVVEKHSSEDISEIREM